MNILTFKKIVHWSQKALWAAVLVTLPITSLPLLSKLTGGTMVAPLSAVPLGLLILVWFIPHLMRRGSLPRETFPLIIFLLATVGIAAAAFFLNVTYYKEKTLLSQTIRVFFTVTIGVAFYFTFSAWPKNEIELRKTIQLINIGGIFLIGWALLQLVYVLFVDSKYPAWFNTIRNLLVFQQSTVTAGNRITGFAYEPSWFTHQLNMLYLPLWLASSYQRTSAFRWRFFKLSFENIFLGFGMLTFFFSSPRVSMVALIFILAFLLVKIIQWVYHKIVQFIAHRWMKKTGQMSWVRWLTGAGMLVAFIAICFTFVWLYLQLGSRRDWRLNLLTQNPLSLSEVQSLSNLNEDSILYLGQRFAFLERLTYWFDGWHIFNDYPITGVGLGNAGFYFYDRMPAVGWGLYELRDSIFRASTLPNIKSLWVRLLAETGIVGFVLFLTWYFLLWRSAGVSQNSRSPLLKMVALAGQLALIAFLVEGFSIDSFALPYLWVITGLISSTGALVRKHAATTNAQN